MKLEDIKEQLFAWFEPEDHKTRRLKGGGSWVYLSHQVIRDRLNEVCFGYWNDEYSEPTLTGNTTTVMCRLTICGVTRTGIADDKTFPELNDDGKEKIIGSVVVNVSRHAFRDAAEKFGIGAYLDSQKGSTQKAFMQYMTKRGDRRIQDFTKGNEYVEAGAKGIEQTTVSGKKPTKPKMGLYPQHKAIANSLVKELNLKFLDAKFILDSAFSGKSPDDLSPEQFGQFIEKLVLAGWSAHYPSGTNLLNAYRAKLAIYQNDYQAAIAKMKEQVAAN